jgi:hypothetical protein
VTVKLLLAAMEENPGKKFLIDGFPRSMDNKDGWFQVVGDKAEVAFCLFYDCPEEELEKRLLKRGETSGRDDDNIESIKKRFRTFKETSMPVVEWFEGRGQLRKVSSAQSVEDVWAATQRIFDEAGVFKVDAPACKVPIYEPLNSCVGMMLTVMEQVAIYSFEKYDETYLATGLRSTLGAENVMTLSVALTVETAQFAAGCAFVYLNVCIPFFRLWLYKIT